MSLKTAQQLNTKCAEMEQEESGWGMSEMILEAIGVGGSLAVARHSYLRPVLLSSWMEPLPGPGLQCH